jgi:hypothetical protein
MAVEFRHVLAGIRCGRRQERRHAFVDQLAVLLELYVCQFSRLPREFAIQQFVDAPRLITGNADDRNAPAIAELGA